MACVRACMRVCVYECLCRWVFMCVKICERASHLCCICAWVCVSLRKQRVLTKLLILISSLPVLVLVLLFGRSAKYTSQNNGKFWVAQIHTRRDVVDHNCTSLHFQQHWPLRLITYISNIPNTKVHLSRFVSLYAFMHMYFCVYLFMHVWLRVDLLYMSFVYQYYKYLLECFT